MTCGVRWGDGRFANRPYGEREGRGLLMRGKTDVGGGRATTRVAPTGEGKGGGGWVSACVEGVEGREYPAARFLEGLGMTFGVRWGDGRFANRPYGEREGEGFVHARGHGEGEGVPGGEIP